MNLWWLDAQPLEMKCRVYLVISVCVRCKVAKVAGTGYYPYISFKVRLAAVPLKTSPPNSSS